MVLLKGVAQLYPVFRKALFACTSGDAERAHAVAVFVAKAADKFYLGSVPAGGVPLSNAAGMNKNCEFSPRLLGALGFDRAVVGTVPYHARAGNPRPRVWRYPSACSIVNWQGLPSEGFMRVADRLESCIPCLPVTVSVAPEPDCEKGRALVYLQRVVERFAHIPSVDRFELNISCPNCSDHLDRYVSDTMDAVKSAAGGRALYCKLSPDLSRDSLENIAAYAADHRWKGLVVSNATAIHPGSVEYAGARGGLSGDLLFEKSLASQRIVQNICRGDALTLDLIACGGISSPERLGRRMQLGAVEAQIYTPLVFQGPALISRLKSVMYPGV